MASFLCHSLPSDLRKVISFFIFFFFFFDFSHFHKTHESDLLRIYHQTLLNEGVSGYKFQKCWSDYKTFVLLAFAQFVCNGAGLFVLEQQGKRKKKKFLEFNFSPSQQQEK